jgi:hypothetical protein
VEELRAPDALDAISAPALRALIAAAAKLYSEKVQRDGGFPIIDAGSLTATDGMIVTTAILKAVNVQVFELGCWQSWAG